MSKIKLEISTTYIFLIYLQLLITICRQYYMKSSYCFNSWVMIQFGMDF